LGSHLRHFFLRYELNIRGKMAILERQGEVAMGAEGSDQLYLRLKPPMER